MDNSTGAATPYLIFIAIIKPNVPFWQPLQDIARPLGDPLVLEVRIGSNLPVPTVHWYHNNKPARESKEKDIRFLNNGKNV